MSNNVQPETTDPEDHRPSTASSSTRTTRSQTRRSSLPNPFTTTTNTSKKRTRDQTDDQEEPEQPQASSNNTRSSTLPKTTATSSKHCDAPEPPPATKRSRRSLPNLTPASKPSPSTADRKGKKRILPSSPSPPPLPQQPAAGSSSLSTITPARGKKIAKSKNNYALRSATATIPSINTTTSSPKSKAKAATSNKGKAKQQANMAKKAKSVSKQKSGGERMAKGNSGPGGSGSSRRQQRYDDMDDMDSDMEDVAMLGSSDEDIDIERDAAAVDDKNTSSGAAPAASSSSNAKAAVPPASSGGGDGGMGGGAAAAALFGSDFRSLGGYMIGLSSRLKSILTHIKSTNPTIQLSALQEASEVLSVSTEDTLAGYFQVDAFVKEFVAIMAGKPTSPAEPDPAKSSSGRTGAVSGSGSGRSTANCNDDDVDDDDHGDGDDLHRHEDDESVEDHDDNEDGEEGGGESGSDDGEGEGDHDEEDDPFGHSGGGGEVLDEYEDEDVALARALAMSTQDAFGGGGGGGDMIMMGEDPSADKLEAQLLACRCLANLMEALPGSAHTVVHHGAVPVLCSKLVEIQYIDLAEQTLSTMEKISQEYPSAIVREGGLGALLNFLDFFSTNIQRTAVTAAANCCRNISTEHFDKVREVFPMLRNVLSYPDQRLVEQGALAVVRTLDAYRYKAEHLEDLLDVDLVRALNTLLLPAGGSPALSTATYTHLLRAMTAGAKSSPKVTLVFLEAGMVDTLYQIFTGVQPGTHDADEQGNSAEGQGLGGGLADMLVLHNLAHRPKEHIEEALALLSELLPPLPRDGVFDSKGYTEKALSRLARAKAKASRATSRQPSSTSLSTAGQEAVTSSFSADVSEAPSAAATAGGEQAGASSSTSIVAADDPATIAHKDRAKEADQATEIRLEALRSKPELVSRFLKMLLPVLVDVYAASVALRVRTKVLTGLLKTISFLPSEDLPSFLENVPLPSFLGSILSSREFPTLVSAALQLVELLTIKLPAVYKTSFRREGVMYEVDLLAEQELSTAKATKKAEAATASAILASKATEPSSSADAAANPPATTTDSEVAPAAGSSSVPAGLSTPARSTSAAAASFAALASSPAAASNPSSSVKRSSSVPLDPQDANILRARVMRTKTVADAVGDSAGEDEAAQTLDRMRGFVAQLTDKEASVKTLENVMTQLAVLFAPGAESVSSFELLQSGLVDGLLECTIIDGETSSAVRRRLLFQILSMEGADGAKSPLAMLIKRLQESLSRMESSEVLTAFYGLPGDDSKRNSASLLARQLRLKLVAEEGSDVPKSSSALVVSIQAIATFQALNDYLRPRIAAPPTSLGGNSRLSADGPGMGPSSSASSALRAALSAASGLDFGDPPSSSSKVKKGESSSSTDKKAEAADPSSSSAKADEAGDAKLERRRSARLNKTENGKDAADASGAAVAAEGGAGEGVAVGETGGSSSAEITAAAGGAGPSAAAREAASKLSAALDALLPAGMEGLEYDEFDDEEGMYSDEYDDDLFDGGLEDEIPRPAEKTVDLAVAADGSKVEVKTPDGTRISTPTQPAVSAGGASTTALGAEDPSPSGSMPPGAPARSSSYAGALKSKPTDWHLQFSMNGKVLPLDTTVFGAIHRAESSAGVTNGLQRGVWSGVYTVNFKKVSGAAPALAKEKSPEPSTRDPSSATAVPDSVPQDSPQAKILRLLRVFHALNAEAGDSTLALRPATLPESAFVNNKLTAKLGRQLEEPMIIASKCLPDWAQELPRFFPFLFPFETRFAFLESTSFGYSRLIQKWASQQAKSSSSDSRRNDDSLSFLSRLQRQKVRISRNHLLESALKVFELYGTGSAILEVEYFDEVGTGLGPTLEFYSLVSREFARRDLKLWRDADSSTPGDYVHRPQGLFPRPLSDVEASGPSGVQYDKVYRVLGQFVAKALIDSRIIDMSFNPVFLKLAQGHSPPLTIDSLRSIDVRLAKSLARVAEYAEAKKVILADQALSEEDKASQIEDVVINHVRLIDLCLDFTLPGYDIELKAGGANLAVDMTNVEEYLAMVLEYTLIKGTASAVAAFRAGFSTIFPVRDLQAFSADELVILFGSAEEDWSIDTLNNAMKADHGYNIESRSISHLIEVMSSYDAPERREFLQFITGSPRLPTGGFKSLHPPLTVVRKGHEPPLKPDDYLPSVMTCVNYLKLPDYSSREVLASKLSTAMREGGGAFHLS